MSAKTASTDTKNFNLKMKVEQIFYIEFRACSETLYNKFQLGDKIFHHPNQIMDRTDYG